MTFLEGNETKVSSDRVIEQGFSIGSEVSAEDVLVCWVLPEQISCRFMATSIVPWSASDAVLCSEPVPSSVLHDGSFLGGSWLEAVSKKPSDRIW